MVEITGVLPHSRAHKAGIREHIRSTPKALDARFVHFFEHIVCYLVKAAVCLVYVIRLGNYINIVEAEVFDTKLLHKLKVLHLPCRLHQTPARSAKVMQLCAECFWHLMW